MDEPQTLEEIDRFVEELGIDVITPAVFASEKIRLEQRIAEFHGIDVSSIRPKVARHEIDGDLVEEWLELVALEPYMEPHDP